MCDIVSKVENVSWLIFRFSHAGHRGMFVFLCSTFNIFLHAIRRFVQEDDFSPQLFFLSHYDCNKCPTVPHFCALNDDLSENMFCRTIMTKPSSVYWIRPVVSLLITKSIIADHYPDIEAKPEPKVVAKMFRAFLRVSCCQWCLYSTTVSLKHCILEWTCCPVLKELIFWKLSWNVL